MKKPLTAYYSLAEVTEALGVSRRTVFRWLESGTLQGAKVGGQWRISETQLQVFLEASNRVPAPKSEQVKPSESLTSETERGEKLANATGTNAERRARDRKRAK